MIEQSCGNCIQCEKYEGSDGEERWSCENYYHGVGMPYDVYPPNDDACPNWSDNPEDKDKPSDALRYFVDHYLDEDDEWFWDEEA